MTHAIPNRPLAVARERVQPLGLQSPHQQKRRRWPLGCVALEISSDVVRLASFQPTAVTGRGVLGGRPRSLTKRAMAEAIRGGAGDEHLLRLVAIGNGFWGPVSGATHATPRDHPSGADAQERADERAFDLKRSLACLLVLVSLAAHGAEPLPLRHFQVLLSGNPEVAQESLNRIGTNWQPGYAAMLLETVGLVPDRQMQSEVLALLARASGKPFRGDLNAWYQWLWSMPPAEHPEYAEFKASLYEQIDPRFREYFANRPKAIIRLDEIRWGGVWRDGIPPLENPKMLAARDARYLADSDVVFGVAIDGDARAYPKRILAWHEMVRDTIAGRPLNGVYCTLCGAMILFDVTVAGVHHKLGTSGFLYRSNKLMYDHATKSLWSTLTGTPVVGPLVGQGIELTTLYVVTTTWKAWRARHPETLVLSPDTGHLRDYSEGAAYRDYFATDRLMFGVPKQDDRLPNKAEVLVMRAGKEQLAIAADFLASNRVYHGELGGRRFVVLTDASGANRAYESGNSSFVNWDNNTTARDTDGRSFKVGEDALTGPAGKTLKRLPAHRAFWFGWYAAYPDTRLVK